jgi:hypothetical protein
MTTIRESNNFLPRKVRGTRIVPLYPQVGEILFLSKDNPESWVRVCSTGLVRICYDNNGRSYKIRAQNTPQDHYLTTCKRKVFVKYSYMQEAIDDEVKGYLRSLQSELKELYLLADAVKTNPLAVSDILMRVRTTKEHIELITGVKDLGKELPS